MERTNIEHLGRLARLAMTDEEIVQLQAEIPALVTYVSEINSITAAGDITKHVGPVHNVFREDEVTTPPGTHTDTLLAATPDRKNNYLRVKKILDND